MTTAPAAAAMGPNFLLIEPPALNRARSTPLKEVSVEFLDRVLGAGERDLLALGPCGRQHEDVLHGQLALLQDVDEVLADRPGRTHDGYTPEHDWETSSSAMIHMAYTVG